MIILGTIVQIGVFERYYWHRRYQLKIGLSVQKLAPRFILY